MSDRLSLIAVPDSTDLLQKITAEMAAVCGRPPAFSANTHPTLHNCCDYVIGAGATFAVIQRRVLDPDFQAEYSAYYSRQFGLVSRDCTRIHFFSAPKNSPTEVLAFLDEESRQSEYLGFLTLRPVMRTPIGASIFGAKAVNGFIKSADKFPVRLGGIELEVNGTPFMQQDNAVGACAQASIWMALRTLRKREGDRAHDPAQITDAATRFLMNGRKLPNRNGLTPNQMMEAVRAAGYSPHYIQFGTLTGSGNVVLNQAKLLKTLSTLHPYIESEIPVLMILIPKANGAHAVVAIGHSWSDSIQDDIKVTIKSPQSGLTLAIQHAASWTPEVIVHNDNTGPYRKLPAITPHSNAYGLDCTLAAIPLLPSDVFMTGEEAMKVGGDVLHDLIDKLRVSGVDAQQLAQSLVIRLLLIEKRKLRKWAADTALPPELKRWLRIGDLPKRVWTFEVHLAAQYGDHGKGNVKSLVGLVLMDPTGDAVTTSVLMTYFDLPSISKETTGTLSIDAGGPVTITQIASIGPTAAIRI